MNEITKSTNTAISSHTNFFDPQQFETIQRVCRMLSSSDLVPELYKASDKTPKEKAVANCMIAVEIALRIGASPLMIMQNMSIIHGRPAWSSKFLIATVNTCGRFNPLRFKFTDKGVCGIVNCAGYGTNNQFDGSKITNVECIAYTTAKDSEEILESTPVTIKLAIQEGWYTKKGSKWQTMPQQMLMYRAASFWANAYAPEISMGMRTTEEQQDIYTDYEEITDAKEELKQELANFANQTEVQLTTTPKDNAPTNNTESQQQPPF